jgi:hypothetical protein
MQIRSDNKSEEFYNVCNELQTLTEKLIASKEKKHNRLSAFFKARSVAENVAISLQEAAGTVSFSIDFPYIKTPARIKLIKKCLDCYRQLQKTYCKYSNKEKHADDIEFYHAVSTILKKLTYYTIGVNFKSYAEININYLPYYLNQIDEDFPCFSNYLWLKEEFSAVLSLYKTAYPLSPFEDLINVSLEVGMKENISINRYAENDAEKLDNLIHYINSLRSVLIDEKESYLAIQLYYLLCRALDIETQYNKDSALYTNDKDYPSNVSLVRLR